jgi:hypothetical protein
MNCQHNKLGETCLDCEIAWAELYLRTLQSIREERLQEEASGAAPPCASGQQLSTASYHGYTYGEDDGA